MRKTYKILCKAAVILSIVVMVAQLILAIFAKDSLPDIIVTVAAITLGVEAVGMLVAGIAYSFTITNPGKKHLYAIMIIAGLTNILFLIAGFVGLKSKDEETDRLISEDKIAVFFRKIMVTLKYRTNIVPMVVMLVGFLVFSLQITSVSETTLYIGKDNMGLFMFASYLFSILAMVTLLNSFPRREKPRIVFIILTLAMIVAVMVMDVLYIGKINAKFAELGEEGFAKLIENGRDAIVADMYGARTATIVNIVFEAVCALLIAFLPVIKKLLMKINTRVVFDENANISDIDLSEGDEAESKRSGGMRATK